MQKEEVKLIWLKLEEESNKRKTKLDVQKEEITEIKLEVVEMKQQLNQNSNRVG